VKSQSRLLRSCAPLLAANTPLQTVDVHLTDVGKIAVSEYPYRNDLSTEGFLKKLIITGANGVGKSHLAARMANVRPDLPIVSFDAIKLRTAWQQRPRPEIALSLDNKLKGDAWILEGGPSLLPLAVTKADALIWLDPPEYIRAWRLTMRPWRFLGKTRPELPSGNVDWPIQQYKFALRSLKNRSKFQLFLSEVFQNSEYLEKWHCKGARDIEDLMNKWTKNTN